jgi:predicted 2-oxoglutarate/Fe(II)-dependent dioxygenase YbiX
MPDLKELIYVKKVFTEEQCDLLIEERDRGDADGGLEKCPHSITNVMTTSSYKVIEMIPGTETFNMVKSANEGLLNDWFDYLHAKKRYYVHGLKKSCRYSHMYRLMKYTEGDNIHPHIDWTHLIMGSLTIQLNDPSEYDGGNFMFFNGEHEVKLKRGEAMVFPANHFFVHEVRPLTRGVRYSVNSFLCTLPKDYTYGYNDSISEQMTKTEMLLDPFFYSTSDQKLKD